MVEWVKNTIWKKKFKIFWPENHKILKKSKKKWNLLSLHKSFGLQDLVSKTHMQSFLGQIWPILMEIFIFWELGDRTNQEIECKIAPSSLLVTLLSWNFVFELEFNHRIGRVSKKYNLKKKIQNFLTRTSQNFEKIEKKWNFLSLHKSFGLQDLVSKTHMQSFFGSNMAYIDGNIHILRTRRHNEPGDRV